jgi:hypothetical protein
MARQNGPTGSDLRPMRDSFGGTIVNVRDHGARGDDKGDDTDALEVAIAALVAGDALYFPAGTYHLSRPLEPRVRALFFSLTDRAVLRARGTTGFPMFILRAGAAEFHRLTIDCARLRQGYGGQAGSETGNAASPAPAIWRPADAPGAVDVAVFDCHIRNAHDDGIRIQGGSGDDRAADRVIVRDTIVEGCGMNGLSIGRVDNIRIESSRFERCHNGIKVLNGHDVSVHAVSAIANGRHGIGFTFSHRVRVDGCIARGNGSKAEGGWGIAAGGEPIDGLVPNSDFTITNNICEDNTDGGITLDPTTKPDEGETEVIWPQRAQVSGNVCRSAGRYHGIHITHGSEVAVTGNVCSGNANGSGIQLVSSKHVLVQGNVCFDNHSGIGLFSRKGIPDPGHHVIGINMLHENDVDIRHQESGVGEPLTEVRIHGLHGSLNPEGNVKAEPGTIYEWHDGNQGGAYVKAEGMERTGWKRVLVT